MAFVYLNIQKIILKKATRFKVTLAQYLAALVGYDVELINCYR